MYVATFEMSVCRKYAVSSARAPTADDDGDSSKVRGGTSMESNNSDGQPEGCDHVDDVPV